MAESPAALLVDRDGSENGVGVGVGSVQPRVENEPLCICLLKLGLYARGCEWLYCMDWVLVGRHSFAPCDKFVEQPSRRCPSRRGCSVNAPEARSVSLPNCFQSHYSRPLQLENHLIGSKRLHAALSNQKTRNSCGLRKAIDHTQNLAKNSHPLGRFQMPARSTTKKSRNPTDWW